MMSATYSNELGEKNKHRKLEREEESNYGKMLTFVESG